MLVRLHLKVEIFIEVLSQLYGVDVAKKLHCVLTIIYLFKVHLLSWALYIGVEADALASHAPT